MLKVAMRKEKKEAVLFQKKEPKNFCLLRATSMLPG
jgi:hypothetical protein